MLNLNRHVIAGNLGDDARIFGAGASPRTFHIRVATHTTSGSGETVTEWHDVKAFAKTDEHIEFLRDQLKKGALVYVEGDVRTDRWTDEAGAERTRRVIYAQKLQVVVPRERQGQDSSGEPRDEAAPPAPRDKQNLANF